MPVDIVSIIQEEVGNLTTHPAFTHGGDDWKNYKADKQDTTNGVVYLDEPISSDDKQEITGAYTESYPLKLFIGRKVASTQLNDYDELHAACIESRAVRKELIIRLRNRDEIFALTSIKTVEVLNRFDKNLSGVIIYLTAVCQTGDSICIDDTTLFKVTSTAVDLNPDLNGINDEELDADGSNIDRDRTEEPMGSRLIALNSSFRLVWGLSDSHEGHYLEGDDTALSGIGKQINGTRFKLGIDCDGSQPQFDAMAILNGLACGVHTISYFGASLDMAVATGSRIAIVHNPRVDDPAETIIGINALINLGIDVSKIIVCMGFEFGDPNAYPEPNGVTFPTPEDFATSQTISANTIQAAFPENDLRFVFPGGKVFKNAAWVIPWNTALKGIVLNGNPKIYIDNYFKISDLYTPSEVYNEANWRSTMITGCTTTLSEYIALFKSFFPGKGLFIPYMGTDGGPQKISDYLSINSMLGLSLMHRQIMLEHVADPNLILGVAHYKPGSMQLQNDTPRYDYFELLKFAQLFQYETAKVCTVETGIAGVYAVAVKSGSDYTIQITNTNNAASLLPPIDLDGEVVSEFTGTVSRGASLDSQTVINEDFDGVNIPGLAVVILNTV